MNRDQRKVDLSLRDAVTEPINQTALAVRASGAAVGLRWILEYDFSEVEALRHSTLREVNDLMQQIGDKL
jgi:hypothetical protein